MTVYSRRMSIGLPFDTLVAVSEVQLETLAAIGNPRAVEHAAPPFILSKLVGALQETLRRTYAAAATAAREADGPAEAADVWKRMGTFTDAVLELLVLLKDNLSDGSSSALYDLALDYKLACQRRYTDCEGEVSCLNENRIPAGLFPVLN